MDAMRNVASMAKSSDFKRTVRELKVSRVKHTSRAAMRGRV